MAKGEPKQDELQKKKIKGGGPSDKAEMMPNKGPKPGWAEGVNLKGTAGHGPD